MDDISGPNNEVIEARKLPAKSLPASQSQVFVHRARHPCPTTRLGGLVAPRAVQGTRSVLALRFGDIGGPDVLRLFCINPAHRSTAMPFPVPC
jgi:hypothetical protein